MDNNFIEITELHNGVSHKVSMVKGLARIKVPVQSVTHQTFWIVKKGRIRVSFQGKTDIGLKSGGTLLLEPSAEYGLIALSDFEIIAVQSCA